MEPKLLQYGQTLWLTGIGGLQWRPVSMDNLWLEQRSLARSNLNFGTAIEERYNSGLSMDLNWV